MDVTYKDIHENDDVIMSDKEKIKEEKLKEADKFRKKMIILMFIMMLFAFGLNLWRHNSWRFFYEIKSETIDDRGVTHYELYDKKNDFTFNYYKGKYKKALFTDSEGVEHLRYTVHVCESDFVGKYLYNKMDNLNKILKDAGVDYVLEIDEESKAVESIVVEVDDFLDAYSHENNEGFDDVADFVGTNVFTNADNELGMFVFRDTEGAVVRTRVIKTH